MSNVIKSLIFNNIKLNNNNIKKTINLFITSPKKKGGYRPPFLLNLLTAY